MPSCSSVTNVLECPNKVYICCLLSQAIQEAAIANNIPLSTLAPAVLREALRRAGNVVRPSEVEEVLSFVTSDDKVNELHGLHLLLLRNGAVHQISWPDSAQDQAGPIYYYYDHKYSKGMYSLMINHTDRLVAPSEAWTSLAQ